MNEPIPAISGYAALGITLIIVTVLALAFVGVSMFLGPKRPTRAKTMPYESGINPVGGTRRSFGIHYYVVAMLFIIFDIEAIFLYPWAIQMVPALGQAAGEAGSARDAIFLLVEMSVFMTILFVGYVYMFKKGALDWE